MIPPMARGLDGADRLGDGVVDSGGLGVRFTPGGAAENARVYLYSPRLTGAARGGGRTLGDNRQYRWSDPTCRMEGWGMEWIDTRSIGHFLG